jgi:hypothetical protein
MRDKTRPSRVALLGQEVIDGSWPCPPPSRRSRPHLPFVRINWQETYLTPTVKE